MSTDTRTDEEAFVAEAREKAEGNLNTLLRAKQVYDLATRLGLGDDVETGISDLIVDLLHLQERWSRQGRTDADGYWVIQNAEHHFICERDGDDLSGGPFKYGLTEPIEGRAT